MLSTEQVEHLYRCIRAFFMKPPLEAELQKMIRYQSKPLLDRDITEEELREVQNYYEQRASVRQPHGLALESPECKNRVWYRLYEPPQIGYWSRFYDWMQATGKLESDALATLDHNSSQILSRLGDPRAEAFKVRGLVLGDVQSGKTLNYSALINKAIDAGYRVVIILSGILESLRKQTQIRTEESVSGTPTPESNSVNSKITDHVIGCGEFSVGELYPTCLMETSRYKDFGVGVGSTKISTNHALVFVTKKNRAILERIHDWLTTTANPGRGKKIEGAPLLLIDDEADNASINVKADDKEPTKINQFIRKILGDFEKSSYVGFTATPYANIFINPDSKRACEFNDDLFPKDFIYLIRPPTDYVGAVRIFGPGADHRHILKKIDDMKPFLPSDHKIDVDLPCELPDSLKEALRIFVLTSAIRDCRRSLDSNIHRTMLVNVSRFIKVQTEVADKIRLFLKKHIQDPIIVNAKNEDKTDVPDIEALFDVYQKAFGGLPDVRWDEVFDMAAKHVAEFEVVVCNSKSNPLSYPKDSSRRLIVVGGLAVSRGLTLEGLSTTYLSRNTRMYDALMQMGRWFGYRMGYDHLCRIYMSETSINWYRFVTKAHMELVSELDYMESLNRTPADFGLRIRQDDLMCELQITALNKMRNSYLSSANTSVLGTVVEFPLLSRSPLVSEDNEKLAVAWWGRLSQTYQKAAQESPSASYFKGVAASEVLDFLHQYQIADLDAAKLYYRQISKIIRQLSEADVRYSKWTVARVASKGSDDDTYVERQMEPKNNLLRVSKRNAHLSGGRVMGKIGLEKAEIACIKERIDSSFSSERSYYMRGISREPTLVLYPIKVRAVGDGFWDKWTEEEKAAYRDRRQTVYGITIGFPDFDGAPGNLGMMPYSYRLNVVAQQQMLDDCALNDEYEDSEEE